MRTTYSIFRNLFTKGQPHTIIALKNINDMILYCISKYKSTILGRPEKIEELTRELEQEKINKIILFLINQKFNKQSNFMHIHYNVIFSYLLTFHMCMIEG